MIRSILDLNGIMRDAVHAEIMRQVAIQEEELEALAISGCFVEDMWIVYRPSVDKRWGATVGEPQWRLAYSEDA